MGRTDARLHLGVTEAGKVILHGIGLVAFTALIFPAFGVLSALVWVMLVALLAGFVLRPRIRLSGNLPDRIMAGQTAQLRYTLKNTGRFGAYNLCVTFRALPDGIEQVGGEQVISRLGPGETAEVTVAIRPNRRGYHRIKQPVCQSGFPFNLFSFGTSGDREENLLVLPAFSRLRFPTRGLSRQVRAGSTRPAGRMGLSPEYAGNRPFVPGDSPRRIDARAWARLSVPATKEYCDDFDNYTALVLDTAVPRQTRQPSHEIKQLEAAVSLCASVAFSINDDCLIDLLLAGPDLHQFTDRPRSVRLDGIHEILAGVEPSGGYSLEHTEQLLANRLWEISEVVFILLSWNKAYRPLLELAAQAHCCSTVLLIGESEVTHMDHDGAIWVPDVQVLSPDEILTGRTECL